MEAMSVKVAFFLEANQGSTKAGSRKLLLMDGNSVLYRAFYGVPLLSTSKGEFTNAVYGMAQMVVKLLDDFQPTHVAVAFDKGKVTFRHEFYSEYKGKRQATPDELVGQFQMARDLLAHFRIAVLERELIEADDIIGTLATQASQDFDEVVLISGDKDLFQLVDDRVIVYMTKKGITDLARYDKVAVAERYEGLTPEQMIDLKGLMGDSSDNIPGVPGVGEKTAIKLLQQFPTLEEVLSHIDEVNGNKLKERLREHGELARLSKKLATIRRDVELPLTPEALYYEGYDEEELKSYFRELEFRTLAERLKPWGAKAGQVQEAAAVVTDATVAEAAVKMHAIDELSLWWKESVSGDVVGMLFDIEGSYQEGQIRGIAIATAEHAAYFSADVASGKVEDSVSAAAGKAGDSVRAALTELMEQDGVTKVVYDFKALLVAGKRSGWLDEGLRVPKKGVFDSLLATYLVHASEGEPGLVEVLEKSLPDDPLSEADRVSLEKRDAGMPGALVSAAQKLVSALAPLRAALDEYTLTPLYEQVEWPLTEVLAEMELLGVRLDVASLQAIGQEFTEKIDRLTKEIHLLAGVEFNINSPKQLGEILFDKMNLPPIKKTKTGYSTSADVLEKLAPQSEFVQHILDYRQLAKLQSTYVEGLLKVVRMPESRVHTSFRQAMTATGRLSSIEPNLQNIPIRMEEGRRLRQAFVPSVEGWQMLSGDYSQVELRILAHLCQDQALVDAFLSDMDIHTRTASDVFEVKPEEVTLLMRRQAKAVNFGIIYGISDYGLAQNLNISRAQAARFIEQYFAKFPGVKRYMEETVELARERGYVETVLGRRRYLPQIRSRNFNERSFAERTAMNTPIQGTAADMIKLAMVNVQRRLREEKWESRMLLQVHDELIFEGPKAELAELSMMVQKEMQEAVPLIVPLKVDLHAGDTWYDAK